MYLSDQLLFKASHETVKLQEKNKKKKNSLANYRPKVQKNFLLCQLWGNMNEPLNLRNSRET